MSDSHQSTMTPMGYLKIFFRRKEILIVAAFVGIILGICAGILMPKEFMSSTIILVEEGKSDNPLFNNLAVSTSVKQRLVAIRESMLGWNSLVKLVKRLEMDKEITTPRELESLILGIRKNITIQMRGNNIINLAYYGKDPLLTQAVVKNITEIFIERNVEIQNQETADAIAFIEEQLKVYKGKIKSSEIAYLKDELNTMLIDSTEEHPQVKKLREDIKAKETELKKENLQYSEGTKFDDKTTNPIINEIKKALDTLEGDVSSIAIDDGGIKDEYYKVMLIDKLDSVMARDADVNNKIYNMLLERLETAKITQRLQSSKEGTKYTILDPPRLPLDPIKPNKPLIALIGLVAGVLIGVGLVIATEFMDRSFIDVEEAKQFLGTPLLGAISKINTEDSLLRSKEKLRWFYGLMVVSGIIVVVVTTALANFLK